MGVGILETARSRALRQEEGTGRIIISACLVRDTVGRCFVVRRCPWVRRELSKMLVRRMSGVVLRMLLP